MKIAMSDDATEIRSRLLRSEIPVALESAAVAYGKPQKSFGCNREKSQCLMADEICVYGSLSPETTSRIRRFRLPSGTGISLDYIRSFFGVCHMPRPRFPKPPVFPTLRACFLF